MPLSRDQLLAIASGKPAAAAGPSTFDSGHLDLSPTDQGTPNGLDLTPTGDSAPPEPEARRAEAFQRGVEDSIPGRDKIGALAAVAGHMSTGLKHDMPAAEVYKYQLAHPELSEGDAKQALLKERFGDPTLGDVYREARGENEAETAALRKQHPGYFLGGNLAGGVLLAKAPGLGLLGEAKPGAGLATRLGAAAKAGATYGAVNAAGKAHADDPLQYAGEVGLGAGLGGLAGGLLQGGGELLGAGARAMAPALRKYLSDLAARQGVKQLAHLQGGISTDAIPGGVAGGSDRVVQAGADLRQLGQIAPFRSSKSALDNILEQKSDIGQQIGGMTRSLDQRLTAAGKQADPSVNVDVMNVMDRVQKEVIDPLRNSHVFENKALADGVEKRLFEFANLANKNGLASLTDAHQYRAQFDKPLFWAGDPDRKMLGEQIHKMRSIIDDEVDQKIGAAGKAVGSGSEGDTWEKLKRSYSSLSIGGDLATIGKEKELKNASVGLRDYLGLASGVAAGHPMLGAAFGAGTHLARNYGPGVSSAIAGLGEKVAGALPAEVPAAVRSSGAFATIKAMLDGGEKQPANPMRALDATAQNVPELQQAKTKGGNQQMAAENYALNQTSRKYRMIASHIAGVQPRQ